ncbi:hypothetical protein AOLI_G00041470 [Acnodon oligacanthus]
MCPVWWVYEPPEPEGITEWLPKHDLLLYQLRMKYSLKLKDITYKSLSLGAVLATPTQAVTLSRRLMQKTEDSVHTNTKTPITVWLKLLQLTILCLIPKGYTPPYPSSASSGTHYSTMRSVNRVRRSDSSSVLQISCTCAIFSKPHRARDLPKRWKTRLSAAQL